ncbi:MAG TPA: magnesium/cobalt transporter CorA [Candidatus Acidoferrum sp.]|nr:magnesium/cobalt transporter CorA [Candidatus Acidoferrum sp.]
MNMVVGCAAYEGGRKIADLDIDRLDEFEIGTGKGRFVWIGLHEPSEELLQKVQKRFGLHELAVEDAHNAHQRPKLEIYAESLFMVLQTAQRVGHSTQFGETHVFAGRGYVITVRHGPSSSYKEVRNRCEATPRMLKKGEDFVVYAIMDFIVDNYIPVVDCMETEIDELEEEVFKQAFQRDTVERIYELKRDLLELRRKVAPVVDIANRLMRFDLPVIDKDTHPYFRDVLDHAIRVNDSVDYLRELLNSALEVNLLLASVDQSEITKKLASWAAILAVPTAVAGIYGMNFQFMPELHWAFGYPLILLLILGLCGFLYWRFKKARWL